MGGAYQVASATSPGCATRTRTANVTQLHHRFNRRKPLSGYNHPFTIRVIQPAHHHPLNRSHCRNRGRSVVVLCGLAALVWILLRRKPRTGGHKSYGAEGKMDILAPVMSEEDKEAPPAVTPSQHTPFSCVPTKGYAQMQAWPTPYPTGDTAFTPAAFEESNAVGRYYQDTGYSHPMSSTSQSDQWHPRTT